MKLVDYMDDRGRRYRVQLPDGAPDEDAPMGMPVGPPDIVDVIGLPEPLATRLHNLLHERELFDQRSVGRNPQALFGVLQTALRVDAHVLMQAYIDAERETKVGDENGRTP